MFKRLGLLSLVIALVLFLTTHVSAQLLIDFNSTTQDGGPHNMAGYQAYDAGHEVAADFVTKDYTAFGTTVSVTPAWPNTTDNRVRQMIDRSAGNDANWAGDDLDLLTDFIGIDARTGNGGNGDWDRTEATTPTYMTIAVGGLPAGDYQWLSLHHDTENCWPDFQVEVSTDGGATYGSATDMQGTDSSDAGSPASPQTYLGDVDPDPRNLPSTFVTTFTADGTNDVVVRFAPFVDGVDATGVHKQIFVLSGFEVKSAELDCTDGVDNDGDGATDCDDSDCFGDTVNCPQEELDCTDGVDNDRDGDIDCEDADCFSDDAVCPKVLQIAGDANQDGIVDIVDIVVGVRLLFPGFVLVDQTVPEPPCGSDAGNVALLDVNGDGALGTADLVSTAMFLFAGGPPPVQGVECFPILADVGCEQNAACP